MDTRTYVYDRLGKTIRTSRNLRGIIEHYRANPEDLVIKVIEYPDYRDYDVTFYWPHSGAKAQAYWSDWRILLEWLRARRSWSIDRVIFDAPLYDRVEPEGIFDAFRKTGIQLTRYAYKGSSR